MHEISPIDGAIEAMSGQAKLAAVLSVTPSMVCQWRTGRRRVPAERCPAIERATNGVVRCEDLRPDVDWAVLRGQPVAPPVVPVPAVRVEEVA